MKIGIIGLGMVGKAIAHGFTRIGHDVISYDIKLPDTALADVLLAELVFVCVPTPAKADGACDVSIVEKVVGELAEANYKGLVAIKSTVIPGTSQRLQEKHPTLRIAFCPEFLREKAAYTDFVENHDLCVIGVQGEDDYELIKVAHGSLPQNFANLSLTEAELCKYFSNVFNAMKIIFANEFYDMSEKLGVNYQKIKEAMVKRKTIEDVYLDVNKNFRGFGGNCLPKDTAAFAALANQLGLTNTIFGHIVEVNKKFKTTVL